jgi:hypothetical protein
MNWLIKQLFYFKYLVLKQGDLETHLLHRTLANCRHIKKLTPSFESNSFSDGQWNQWLPWDNSNSPVVDYNTFGIFKQQYGKFYFKARLDGLIDARGWPAIWLLELGEDHYYEIDIELFREHFGYTIWWNHNGKQDRAEVRRSLFANRKLYRRLQKYYHLFLIDWSKDWIRFYINGILCAKFRNEIHVPLSIIISKCSMQKTIVK